MSVTVSPPFPPFPSFLPACLPSFLLFYSTSCVYYVSFSAFPPSVFFLVYCAWSDYAVSICCLYYLSFLYYLSSLLSIVCFFSLSSSSSTHFSSFSLDFESFIYTRSSYLSPFLSLVLPCLSLPFSSHSAYSLPFPFPSLPFPSLPFPSLPFLYSDINSSHCHFCVCVSMPPYISSFHLPLIRIFLSGFLIIHLYLSISSAFPPPAPPHLLPSPPLPLLSSPLLSSSLFIALNDPQASVLLYN